MRRGAQNMRNANETVINTGMTHDYYKHSGAFSAMGPVTIIAFGTIGTVILGLIYSYATSYIPFIYLNILLTLGLGFGVGIVVGIGGKIGKVRNTSIMVLFGVIFGLFAEYVQWVFWILAESKQQIFIFNPVDIFYTIQYLAVEGVWSLRGFTPTGGVLYFIWFLEAAIIIVISTLISGSFVKDIPFCEKCDKWADNSEVLAPLDFPDNNEELKSHLEQGDFSALPLLGIATPESNRFITVKLQCCAECKEFYLISVSSTIVTKNNKGEEKSEVNSIVNNLIIDQRVYDSLKNWNASI